MNSPLLSLLLLLSLLVSTSSFLPLPAFSLTRHTSSLSAGGPAPATKTIQKQKTASPITGKPKAKIQVAEPQTRGETETEDAPRYMVIVIGDESYTETHVVARLNELFDDIDQKQASDVYNAVMKTGKGLAGVYPLEQAEFYVEQLLRSEPMIFAELVKEGKGAAP